MKLRDKIRIAATFLETGNYNGNSYLSAARTWKKNGAVSSIAEGLIVGMAADASVGWKQGWKT